MNDLIRSKFNSQKQKISAKEWDQIDSAAKSAELLLTNKKFSFFMEYLDTAKKDIERVILNNTVRDVTEELTVSETLKKKFFKPKKEEIAELSGKYQLITQQLDFLNRTVQIKKEAEELEMQGKLIIERSIEK